MFKTFKVWRRVDNSWTGGGIHENEDYLSEMDKLINDFAKENKLKILSVQHSFVEQNIQHGSASFNVERRCYFMSSVNFGKKLSKIA